MCWRWTVQHSSWFLANSLMKFFLFPLLTFVTTNPSPAVQEISLFAPVLSSEHQLACTFSSSLPAPFSLFPFCAPILMLAWWGEQTFNVRVNIVGCHEHGIALCTDDVLSPASRLLSAHSLSWTLGPNHYMALTNVDSRGSMLPGLLRIASCMLHEHTSMFSQKNPNTCTAGQTSALDNTSAWKHNPNNRHGLFESCHNAAWCSANVTFIEHIALRLSEGLQLINSWCKSFEWNNI